MKFSGLGVYDIRIPSYLFTISTSNIFKVQKISLKDLLADKRIPIFIQIIIPHVEKLGTIVDKLTTRQTESESLNTFIPR